MKYCVALRPDAREDEFRDVARRCLSNRLPPAEINFGSTEQSSLFEPLPDGDEKFALHVPREFTDLMRYAICNRAEDRFALLYDVLWRIAHGERELVQNYADAHVSRLHRYAKNVRRDIHKMHAFVRFRKQESDDGGLFTAWFEPQHFILREAVPFFVDRFSKMNWLIATPIGTACFDQHRVAYGPAIDKPIAPTDTVLDSLWLTYFKTTFNPARLRKKAMLAEMPMHYWRNMPETTLINTMIAGAQKRVDEMEARTPLPPPRFAAKLSTPCREGQEPARDTIDALHAEIRNCRRCTLHCGATQAVVGEGFTEAKIMLVGEQPGDQEDLQGRPFVGPAGQLLDRAIAEAGLSRNSLFLTNAVKHFKYEPRGKRRIHQRPNVGEIQACKWWLDREIAIVRPRLIIALGASAARALMGRAISVTRERGPIAFGAVRGYVTVHPSYLLRLPDEKSKSDEYRRFVNDLRSAAKLDSELLENARASTAT